MVSHWLWGFFGTPRDLGLATATASAAFFPHLEQRIRLASAASVADLPAIRASASGSMCRAAPQGQVTRTRESPKQSSLDVGQHAHGAHGEHRWRPCPCSWV
jgi:hypothetical protein